MRRLVATMRLEIFRDMMYPINVKDLLQPRTADCIYGEIFLAAR